MKKPTPFLVLLQKVFPHRFILARLTNVPVLRSILQRLLFHQTDLTCLPKESVVEISLGSPIKSPDSIVLPSQVVEYFIHHASHRFIMDYCLCRRSMNCKNHPIELGCLFLGEAVNDINPMYGRHVSLTEALDHVQQCRNAGLIHLIGRDHIDKTWLQIKDGKKLMTICNCCECCCLWKWLPDLDPKIRSQIKRMPGVTVKVDKELCVGCGACIDSCFMHAIALKDEKASISEECRGCGRCVERCPSHAIQLCIDDKRFCEKTIEHVAETVVVSS